VKFSLEIEMGNDAVQTRGHIGELLRVVARAITSAVEKRSGKIRDDNGNTVGEWRFTK
jgi:hypothetical protein